MQSRKEGQREQMRTTLFKTNSKEDEIEIELCADCEDHPAMIFCDTCGDAYCNECFISFHKKGQRRYHNTHLVEQNIPESIAAPLQENKQENNEKRYTETEKLTSQHQLNITKTLSIQLLNNPTLQKSLNEYSSSLGIASFSSWLTRSAFIPLRLTSKEQKELSLMECALNISEYTDNVDIEHYFSSQRKIIKYLSELLSIIMGLSVSSDYKTGEQLVKDNDFKNNEKFLQHMFEVARRYKIMNPDKMRDTYGKMIYALMDSQFSDVSEQLGLNLVIPIKTVKRFIEDKDGSDISVFNEDEKEFKGEEIESWKEVREEKKEEEEKKKEKETEEWKERHKEIDINLEINEGGNKKDVLFKKEKETLLASSSLSTSILTSSLLQLPSQKSSPDNNNLLLHQPLIHSSSSSSPSPSHSSSTFFKPLPLHSMLEDPLLSIATSEIFSVGNSSSQISADLQKKENAIKNLCNKYSRSKEDIENLNKLLEKRWEKEEENVDKKWKKEIEEWRKKQEDEKNHFINTNSFIYNSYFTSLLPPKKPNHPKYKPVKEVSEEEVRMIVYSLSDNQSFLRYNSLPCQKMIDFLFYYFSPNEDSPSPAYNKFVKSLIKKKELGKTQEEALREACLFIPASSPPSVLEKEKILRRKKGEKVEEGEEKEEDKKLSEPSQSSPFFLSQYSAPYSFRALGIQSGRKTFVEEGSSNFFSFFDPPSPPKDFGPFTDEEREMKDGTFLQHTPNTWKAKGRLDIIGGEGGARLTHSHSTQFLYVKQSLMLWKSIVSEFFKLWSMAENDLLQTGNTYHLRDTGQGMNRMQSCPNVGREMNKILTKLYSALEGERWVGSSVVHLNDSNVPNAFIFIDKYTQVSRILNPIVSVLERLPVLCRESQAVHRVVMREYGSVDLCRMEILQDFFRHGFDGSGADNGFSAGSCIDGRLTSAWNWCNRLEKKRFFQVFLLCGFVGFDGNF